MRYIDKQSAEYINNVREKLREKKMYEEADELRGILKNAGYEIKDGEKIYPPRFDHWEELERWSNHLLDEVSYYSSRYRILVMYLRGYLISVLESEWVEQIKNDDIELDKL